MNFGKINLFRVVVAMALLMASHVFGISFAFAEITYKYDRIWPALNEPWYFSEPVGIAIDKDENIYVANRNIKQVQQYTSNGVFVTKWSTGAQPSGIAVDRQKNVYLTFQKGEKRIKKFTANGKLITSWGDAGTGDGQFVHAYGIAVDNEGNVYVTDKENHCVQKFTSDGEFSAKWGTEGDSEGQLKNPAGICTDNEGNVYVVDAGNKRVQIFSSEGSFIGSLSQWDDSKTEPPGVFVSPEDIDIDDYGNIYVTDFYFDEPNYRIVKFSSDNLNVIYAKKYKGKGWGIAAKQKIYTTDMLTYFYGVNLFSLEGILITSFHGYGDSNYQFQAPRGADIDRNGNIYITDIGNSRVLKYNSEGVFAQKWEFNPIEENLLELLWNILANATLEYDPIKLFEIISMINQTEMNTLADISLDQNDNIYICDTIQGSVHKINQDNDTREEFEVKTSGCMFPHRIAFDSIGNVYVADLLSCKIFKFDSNWNLLYSWGQKGEENSEFLKISGLEVDTSNNIFVVDSEMHRVQKFSSEGTFLDTWGKKGGEVAEFRGPSDIAIDDSDNIYILDGVNNRIQKFTSDKKFIAAWGERGTLPGQLNFPESIAVSNDGNHVCVVDMWNHRVQTFKKAERPSDTKAIIIAGHAEEPGSLSDDDLWEDTQICANFAYRTLTFQGFTRDTIYYMTPDGSLDLDDNDVMTEVDGAPSTNNLDKVKAWLNEDPKAENIVMYITDHGATDEFIISNNETVSADYLNTWLDDVQKNITGRIIVIYDACYSGSFIPHIKSDNNNRIVIASSSANETAKFIGEGSVSFSKYFWNQIFGGQDIKKSFIDSKTAMITHQTALMEANGDDNVSEPGDFDKVEGLYIGYPRSIASESKLIIGNAYADPNEITSGGSADLYAENINSDNVGKVWAEIIPPGEEINNTGSPVTEYPDCELEEIDNQNYKGTCDGFSVEGLHTIAIYAKDNQNNISDPTIVTVYAENPLPRKAIIVAGANQTDDLWPAVEKGVYSARKALETQGYSTEDIYIMSSSAIQGIEATPVAPDLDSLEYALTDWAGQNTLEMILYFVGYGSEHGLYLNDKEILSPNALKMWLDGMEDTISEKLVVVIDACKSGVFIPGLASNTDRVVITSADAEGPAFFSPEGDMSFSKYFWQEMLSGGYLYDVFKKAENAIDIYLNQTPQLDSNGDGKSDIASNLSDYSIGIGVKLASLKPIIDTISSPEILDDGSTAMIWAKDIVGNSSIEKVWAIITPPTIGNIQNECDLNVFEIELYDVGNGKYEGTDDKFKEQGIYEINVYAKDEYGNTSVPLSSEVIKACDFYEPDNRPDDATVIFTKRDRQEHNFYASGDIDWIVFHAIANEVYEIKVSDLGADCNVKIAIYEEGNFFDPLRERENSELLSWMCPETGIYYVKLANMRSNASGENTDYSVEIERTIAPPSDGRIEGYVYDACTENPITKAQIETTGKESNLSKNIESVDANKEYGIGYYELEHSAGEYEILVEAEGYASITNPINVREMEKISRDFYMLSSGANPSPGDINADNSIDLEDAITALKISANIDSANCVYIGADVNNDGRIGVEDAIYILQWVASTK